MRRGTILIAGGYFTNPYTNFETLLRSKTSFQCESLSIEELEGTDIKPIQSDFVVLLGLKNFDRWLRKRGYTKRKIWDATKKFLKAKIPKSAPLVVVDDLNHQNIRLYQKKYLDLFSTEFNLKRYLLREYLRTHSYPKWVFPFSLPGQLGLAGSDQKTLDIFFRGNASHPERRETTDWVLEHFSNRRLHVGVTSGGVRNETQRLTRNEFLQELAKSKLGLSFSGTGFDCYRYQEIPSVGSLLVSPSYPLVIRNDYEDMIHCIKYSSLNELQTKIETVLGSEDLYEQLRERSKERFRLFHTAETRVNELEDFVLSAI